MFPDHLHECTVSNIFAYLGVSDLCNIDATSQSSSSGMANHGGKPLVWIKAAKQSGLAFINADKASIKGALTAVKRCNQVLFQQVFLVDSDKVAKALFSISGQMSTSKNKHLQVGGKMAESFVAHFRFAPEVVEAYLADTEVAVRSLSVGIQIGNNLTKMVLRWRKGKIWMATRASRARAFQPFGIQIRSVSFPLVICKHFFVLHEVEKELDGFGLSCMMKEPLALAEVMRKGILCFGFVHDPDASYKYLNASAAVSLNLDTPARQFW